MLRPDGSFDYTPTGGFRGQDSFTYRAEDPSGASATATVTLTVSPVDHAPTAVDDAYSTAQDTALSIPAGGVLSNDTDPDGDPLTAAALDGPTHGTLSLQPDGSFVYTPASGYHGTDSFTYRASDGSLDSAPATVSLTVKALNHPPLARPDNDTTQEGTTLTIPASGVLSNDTDPDGDPLTAVLHEGPADGTLTLNADGSFVYTPNAHFRGTDTFTYYANDGQADSNLVAVNINVVDNPPVAAVASMSWPAPTSTPS